MNAVFAPDREQADARKSRPFSELSQGDDPKSTGAPDLKPFRTSCHRNLALVERESEGLARVQAALAARQF